MWPMPFWMVWMRCCWEQRRCGVGTRCRRCRRVLSICRQAEATFDYTHHFDFLMSEMLMADMDADLEAETPMAGAWSSTLPSS